MLVAKGRGGLGRGGGGGGWFNYHGNYNIFLLGAPQKCIGQ